MKKLMTLLLLAAFVWPPMVWADEQPGVYWSFGKLNLTVPFNEVNAVYLYDFVHETNLVGGETTLAKAWVLELTGGGVTSLEGKGTPFVGVNLALPNPADNYIRLGAIKPGLFGGRDFNADAWVGGIKVSASIF